MNITMKHFSKKNKSPVFCEVEGILPKRTQGVEGFTLVELLVAMSVFIIVLTLAVAVFVSALRSQRFLTKLMAVNNNAGLVLEQMAREMRTGYKFVGSASCSPLISFSNSQDTDSTGTGDATTEYRLVNGSIQRTESGAADSSKNGTVTLTASNAVVRDLCFRVVQYSGNGSPQECNPPRIVLTMRVGANGAGASVPDTSLETTVSSRILPVEIRNDPYNCRTQP